MITQKRFMRISHLLLILLIIGLAACQPADPFPLSEPGAHDFGTRMDFTFTDASRADRKVSITVWYPAVHAKDTPASDYYYDAEPDRSGAPYPLVLSSAKVGSIFGPHLASHGFVVVGVKGLDYYIPWNNNLVNQPLDILFALDQVASTPLVGLEGMIDANHAGVMGYSFDGYNALAMSGARVDPEFYLAQCANAASMEPALSQWWIDYYCFPAEHWDEFSANAGPAVTASEDGLWQPMTDARIRAVLPMGPEGAWLFGERGLAAVDRPVLILCGTADEDADYWRESVYIFEHLGAPEKALVSFVGEEHMMIESDEPVARMKHFAVAFLGYHLQGQEKYAGYFSEDFVTKSDGLAWGIYPQK